MTQYKSIYRKWRPQTFDDIVGQGHITQTLKNAIKLNRIAHAYLFSGPRGVGKTTTARIFAKALNCENGPTELPCGVCSRCIRINQGQSMDVLEIDGASNRGIDEIRELRSKIGFAPTEGRYKIYIIDEVHMLTNEAFNALLKTLEEPPGQVLFIFATTAPYKVPNTILSRCQSFYFRRISIEEMVEKLKRIVEEEKLNIDSSSLKMVAESATGSMRDAESILDQVITYGENEVTPEKVREILGLIPHKTFRQLLEAIINHNTESGLKLVNDLVREGAELGQFVQDLIIYTHNLSLLKILDKKNPHSSSYFERAELEKALELSERADTKILLDIIEELKIIGDRMKFNRYPWILLELFVVKMSYIEEKPGQKETFVKNIASKEDAIVVKKDRATSLKEKDLVEPVRKEDKPVKAGMVQKQEIEEIWPKILLRIKEEKISLYSFLMVGKNIRIEGDQLLIGFSESCLFHKESLEKKENRKKIERILKDETNCSLKLRCIVEESKIDDDISPPKENRNKVEEKPSIDNAISVEDINKDENKEIKEIIDHQDILNEALNLFGGNIREE